MQEQEPEHYKFATWNIDQARREENHEETRFDNRWPAIKRYITDARPDLFTLQELRNLTTSEMTVPRLLYEVSQLGYDYKHAYYGKDEISFALAIFYDRRRFFVRDCRVSILPATPSNSPSVTRIVLSVNLESVKTGRRLWFCATHFGLEEHEKDASVEYLANMFRRFLDVNESFFCAGDYNFFDDRDGKKQRAVLTDVAQDAAFPLTNASGTFMGFAHDEFAQPFDAMSRLDHIFYGGQMKCQPAMAYGDMDLVKQRKYPSDHLMILFDFSL